MAFFNLFNKGVKTQIKDLTTFIATVKTAGANAKYSDIRAEFNLRVLSALGGMGFKENADGTWSSTGWSSLPNKNETFAILRLVDDFVKNIEPKLKSSPSNNDDDMRIINPAGNFIVYEENINNARFKEIVIGALTEELSKDDFIILSDLAEQLRSRNIRVAGYWAAGITLTIAAGVGIYMYRKNKAEQAGDTSTSEYDDVGSDVVITVDDEMPVVIITDDVSEVTILD